MILVICVIIIATHSGLLSMMQKCLCHEIKMKDYGAIAWFLDMQFINEGLAFRMNQSRKTENLITVCEIDLKQVKRELY